MPSTSCLPFFTLLFASALILASCSEDTVLKIIPPNKAVEPGADITFQCVHYPEDTAADAKLQWFMQGYTEPISELLQNQTFVDKTSLPAANVTMTPESRYSISNNSLTIKNVTFDDAMSFVCKSTDGKLTKETILKVYVMPSYFTEGMIVVGINIGLIGIFIMCSIWSLVRSRRERQANIENRRKQKLGHREVAKRMLSE